MNDYLGSAQGATAFDTLGVTPAPTTPEQLQQLVRREFELWEPLVRANDIKLD